MDLNKKSLRGLQREAAQRQSGVVDTSVLVDLERIIVDEAIQVRQNGLDRDRVEQYALAMIEYGGYGKFPPLVVFRDPNTNELYLAGGFHRRAAIDLARQGLIQDGKAPIEQVPCEVRTGDRRTAIEFAEDDNLQHGLNLTNRDKQAIFIRRMTEGHIWVEYSRRRIAAELGVDERTIRRWYDSLPAANAAPETTTRIGADGKTYDVSGIQDANRKRAAEADPPGANASQQQATRRSQSNAQPPTPSGVTNGTPDEPEGRFENAPTPETLAVAVNALTAFADDLPELTRQIITVRNAVCYENAPGTEALRGAVVDAFDFLNGYEGAHGKWVDGVIELLEQIRDRLGG